MECPQCGTKNPTNFRCCGGCGQLLPHVVCPDCTFSVPSGFAFCGGCGAAVAADAALAITRTAVSGEAPITSAGPGGATNEQRKLATVLFADVVDFTGLASNADPEALARHVDSAFRRLTEIVVAYGGTVDKYIGDCLMAVFGVPVAHDDDAERAVAAAIAMHQVETGLAFSIGVNSGEVMVMAMGGGGVTVMGDTVNVAARLEKHAGPGEVLVGPLTGDLTRHKISYEARPPVHLKGKAEPIAIFSATAMRATTREVALVPMVGRDDELDYVLSLWRRVQTRRRQCSVLVTGEAGIGKTRLLDELAVQLSDQAYTVRIAYSPYALTGRRTLADLITALGPIEEESVDRLLRMARGDTGEGLDDMDPSAVRLEMLWALRRVVELRTAERPMLLLIDDAHGAHPPSVEFLRELTARWSDLPVLVVFAGRPEGAWLSSFGDASSVRLDALSRPDAAALARAWRPNQPPSDALLRHAAGNPLFVRELLALRVGQGDPDAPTGRVPASLRAVLAARLDALDSAERQIVQDLAVVGEATSVDQLVALSGAGASETVGHLLASGVVRLNPDGTLVIPDLLFREVAYEAMPHAQRAVRHSRAAELSASLSERARHARAAARYAPEDRRLHEQAGDALAAAGIEQIAARPADAVPLLLRAVELGHRAPTTLTQLATLLLYRDRGEALRILDLISSDGDVRVEAEHVHIRANALVDRDPEAALVLFDEAARRWHDLGDCVKEGWAHANKGMALFFQGSATLADEHLIRGLELFSAERYRPGEVAALSLRALVRPEHPDVEHWLHESLAYAIELGDRGRRLSVLSTLAWHHFLRTRLGGPEENQQTHAWIDEVVELGRELGVTNLLLQALCLRANLARLNGHIRESAAALAEAVALGSADSPGVSALVQAIAASLEGGLPIEPVDGRDPFSSIAFVIRAETALYDDRHDDAHPNAAASARSNLGTLEPLVGFISAAALLAGSGEFDRAEPLAAAAREAAVRAEAPTAAIAARAVLAECAAQRGDMAGAYDVLPSPEETPSGGLAAGLVYRARAVLAALDAPRGRATAAETWLDLQRWAGTLHAPGMLRGVPLPADDGFAPALRVTAAGSSD